MLSSFERFTIVDYVHSALISGIIFSLIHPSLEVLVKPGYIADVFDV